MPILDTHFVLTADIPELVRLLEGPSVLVGPSGGRNSGGEVAREGIVIRPLTERRDLIGRVSFKAISPSFLLKYD